MYLLRNIVCSPAVILILLFGAGLYAYFLPGDLIGLDAHSHLGRTWLFKEIILHEHTFPIWSNRWYFGFPLGLYYGFLYFLLSSLSVMMFDNLVLGTKIFLWLIHLCSGIAMYFFIRALLQSVPAAIFSSIFYVFSFQHIGTILIGGKLPLSLIFLFLPIVFYLLEKSIRSTISLSKAATLTAIFLSCSLFTHLQYGSYILLCFCIVLIVRFFTEQQALKRRLLLYGLLTGFFYLAFTAWMILPVFQDSHHLVLGNSHVLSELFGNFEFEKSFQVVKRLFGKGNDPHGQLYYLGIVPLSLILFAWKQPKCNAAFLSYCFIFGAGFLLVLRAPKFAGIWFFFVCLMSGYGVIGLKSMLPKKRHSADNYFTPLLIALLLFDMSLCRMTKPYKKFDAEAIKKIQALMDREGLDGRILVLNQTRSTLWRSLDIIGTDASSPFGGIPQTSTKTHPYAAAIASKAAREIFEEAAELSSSTIEALGFLNIPYVWVPHKKQLIRIPHARPVRFGLELAGDLKNDAGLEKEIWKSIRTQFEKRTLDFSFANPFKNSEIKEADVFTFMSLHETDQEAEMKFENTEKGHVWVAYSYFPHTRIELDGKPVKPEKSYMNFIILPVDKGLHTLKLTAQASQTRTILLAAAGIAGIASLILIFSKKGHFP